MSRSLLIVFDLDGTIWDHEDASQLKPPLKRVSKNSIIDSEGQRLNVYNDVRRVLEELRRAKNIFLAIASWNKPEIVKPILKLLDLVAYFDYIIIEFTDRKDLMIKRIVDSIRRDYDIIIPPENIIYIDDRDVHISKIRETLGNVIFIRMWHDVKSYNELSDKVLSIISNAGNTS